MTLNEDQLRRYARHIVLPQIGRAGQEKLLASSVLVIGAGGLGSSAIAYLAAAGVGNIVIVEPDRVELSNLQRQILFETADIGRSKLEAARDRIEEINSDCRVDICAERFEANGAALVRKVDIVIDGSDNFATRFAASAVCLQEKKPLVSAAISGFEAQLSTFKPYLKGAHPCYRCLVPAAPKREITCEQEGIIGPLAGIMGSFQALEAIKELLGIGTMSGKLFLLDALALQPRVVDLPRDTSCSFCA